MFWHTIYLLLSTYIGCWRLLNGGTLYQPTSGKRTSTSGKWKYLSCTYFLVLWVVDIDPDYIYIYHYYYYYNIYIYIHNRSMSIYIGLHFLGRTFVAGKTGLQSGMIFHLLAFRHDKPWDALSKPHIEELRSHWGVAATFWGCKWKHTLLAKDCISSIQFFFGSIILSHTTHCHGLVLSANQQKSWGRF